MSSAKSIIVVVFIIIAVVLYGFGLQEVAVITFLLGLLIAVLDKIPKSDVNVQILRVDQTLHKLVIENSSESKISDIKYQCFGKMGLSELELPNKLEPRQKVELQIGLSFETGTRLEIEVSWKPQFGLCRKTKRIKTQAIG